MMELNPGLETGILATGLVIMLGMAVWLLFRSDSIGEKSLYSEMTSPHDDEIDNPSPGPLILPSLKEDSSKDFISAHGHEVDVLNKRKRGIPFVQQNKAPLESEHASTNELQDKMKIVQSKPGQQSVLDDWQKSAGKFSGRRSLGGILVVDDDPAIRKLIRLILEPSGYDILVAEDGKDAINVLRSGENPMVIDTIITDLNMPNMDGFEAIVYFQKEFASIPIIVLTGIADAELAVSFMQRGIRDYLVKPIGVEQLKVSVARAIAERQLLRA